MILTVDNALRGYGCEFVLYKVVLYKAVDNSATPQLLVIVVPKNRSDTQQLIQATLTTFNVRTWRYANTYAFVKKRWFIMKREFASIFL